MNKARYPPVGISKYVTVGDDEQLFARSKEMLEGTGQLVGLRILPDMSPEEAKLIFGTDLSTVEQFSEKAMRSLFPQDQ